MLAWSLQTGTLPDDAESRLAAFTDLVAMAISNTASQEELAGLAAGAAALRRVATLVARGVPPSELFTAVASELGRLLDVDATHMERYESDGTAIGVGSWSTDETHLAVGTPVPLDGTSVAGVVFRTGRPARMDNYQDASDEIAAIAQEIGIRSSVGAPIVVDGRLWGVMVASSSHPEPLAADTESRIAAFTELVATAISNSEARTETGRLAEEQAALRRVATLVAEGAAPASLLAVVAEEVARIVHVWSVSIARYEADGTATELANFSDRGELFPVGTRWSLDGTNVLAGVRETGRPARINDHAGLEGEIAQTVRGLGIRSTVGIPILVAGGLWGAMVVSSKGPEPLPQRTAAHLADFTELLATAIANAESRAELAASRARIVATADATRRQIERDLHDGAQQQLVSLALELRAAQAAVPAEGHKHRAELSRAVERLTSVLEELREIARGIHPAVLAEGGLAPALKGLARRSVVPVELDLRAVRGLPERVEVAAYYVVSEALTNAAKYAQASLVHVAVEIRDPMLQLSVRDDGDGGADPARGSGLLGLKDRVEAIGGTMWLQSPPGEGTSLEVELPLDDPTSENRIAASGHITAGR
jgi:signal transduction histidine kinase